MYPFSIPGSCSQSLNLFVLFEYLASLFVLLNSIRLFDTEETDSLLGQQTSTPMLKQLLKDAMLYLLQNNSTLLNDILEQAGKLSSNVLKIWLVLELCRRERERESVCVCVCVHMSLMADRYTSLWSGPCIRGAN